MAFDIDVEYTFEDLSGRTRVTQRSEVTAKGLFRIALCLLGWSMRKSSCKALEKELNALKRFGEEHERHTDPGGSWLAFCLLRMPPVCLGGVAVPATAAVRKRPVLRAGISSGPDSLKCANLFRKSRLFIQQEDAGVTFWPRRSASSLAAFLQARQVPNWPS